jgi:hypothetical protein
VNPNKQPLSVTILGYVYIGVGSIGFVYHLREILARHAFHYDDLLVELTEFVAIVCGAFMLRGHTFARWIALAWIAFHVVLSAFHPFHEFAIHCLLCVAIAWVLFRPEAARYFRRARIEPLRDGR